jgi:mannose-6-phosphate isomerase-like protein (cupin superfamily)
MNKMLLSSIAILLAVPASFAQNPPPPPNPGELGAAPAFATDIPKADIDMLANLVTNDVDKQIRVVDMGKYNMGIGVIHRGPTNDKPGDPIPVLYHDYTAETYIILSGGGVLTTGGAIDNKKADAGPNERNGPGGRGTAGAGSFSRRVQAGDVIIIPTGVAHGWSQVTDQVTYLSVRPDPDRVLPAGWIYPALLKNPPKEVKPATK